jgi:putative transcription factor
MSERVVRRIRDLNCELCGNSIRGELFAVNIDGGVFRVCSSCSHLGTPVKISLPMRKPRAFASSRPSAQSPSPKSNPTSTHYGEQEVELRPDYSQVIKTARETLGLSQEDLGRRINEKPSVISHLETGTLKPSDMLARKLEHFLKVKLFVPVEEEEQSSL